MFQKNEGLVSLETDNKTSSIQNNKDSSKIQEISFCSNANKSLNNHTNSNQRSESSPITSPLVVGEKNELAEASHKDPSKGDGVNLQKNGASGTLNSTEANMSKHDPCVNSNTPPRIQANLPRTGLAQKTKIVSLQYIQIFFTTSLRRYSWFVHELFRISRAYCLFVMYNMLVQFFKEYGVPPNDPKIKSGKMLSLFLFENLMYFDVMIPLRDCTG